MEHSINMSTTNTPTVSAPTTTAPSINVPITSAPTTQNTSIPTNPNLKASIGKLIDESNYSDVKMGLVGRSCFKVTADICETIGHLLVGVAAVISFAAGSFNLSYLSFVAGAVSVIAVSLLKFSSFAMAESKSQTTEINKILATLSMSPVVDISSDPIEIADSTQSKHIIEL
jgi:hypothetical protein